MNVLLIALGCILMALGLLMAANRSGYLYFVVGPRSVLVWRPWSPCWRSGFCERLPDKARPWANCREQRAAL